jgi:hypothetical protein
VIIWRAGGGDDGRGGVVGEEDAEPQAASSMSSLEDAEAAENAGSWSGVCWAVEPVERPEEADA